MTGDPAASPTSAPDWPTHPGSGAAPMAPAQRQMHFTQAEQQNFVRASNPLFDGVVFWINPILGKDECARIAQLLMLGGAQPATIRHENASANSDDDGGGDGLVVGREYKLNGVLVQAFPQMVNHIARFYLPLSTDKPNKDADEDQILRVTHIITPDTHFGEYAAACKAGVHVVTSQWVERSTKSGWQYVERYFSPEAQNIFSGMVVAVTHMPGADKETLLASVMALGGQWREKMRADVTHLILMKDGGPKYEYAMKHPELGIRPIMPHWFVESLNLLHRVPQEPYIFPNPPVLEGRISHDIAKAAPPAAEDNAQVGGKSALAVPVTDTHNGSAYELPKPATQFLLGYAVAISTQLRYSLSEGAVKRLVQRLAEAGATVARPAPAVDGIDITQRESVPESLITDWDTIDILICQHRSGYEYSKASRLGKLVGTFVWLYQAYLSERIVPPTKRLLHYPVPTTPVPGMEHMVITVSHYTGASREYLRRLIIAMGAQYTPKMTRANTHLITAAQEGRKYTTAIDWNIDVVNHFWVEQCYQRWKLLSVSHPTFTYFPELPMLNSMVGETEINVNKLRAWVDPPQGNSLAESSDMDILNDNDFEPVATTADYSGVAMKTDTGHIYEIPSNAVSVNTGDSDDDNEVKSIADSEKSGSDSADGESAVIGQMQHKPRAAAMAASKTLGEMMKAANIFETEMRKERLSKYRKQHHDRRSLVLGEEESDDSSNEAGSDGDAMAVDDEKSSSRNNHIYARAGKRASAKHAAGDSSKKRADRRGSFTGNGGSPEGTPKSHAKRQRTSSSHTSSSKSSYTSAVKNVRIMFTQVRPTPSEQRQIIEMGGDIVESAQAATHLVSKDIKRTSKMLAALSCGHMVIVGRNWMEDSLEQRRWIPVDPTDENDEAAKYHLVDREAEERWDFKLSESLRLARERRMFEGVTVYITPKAEPSFSVLKPIIEIAGGEAVDSLPKSRLNTLINATCRVLRSKSGGDDAIPPLLVVTCKEDRDLWPQFAPSPNKQVPMYVTEALLIGLLRQRLLRRGYEISPSSPQG